MHESTALVDDPDALRRLAGSDPNPVSRAAWSVSLYVKNVFNEEGTTGAFTSLAGGSNTSPAQNYYGNNSRDYIALPRTFGAVLGYRF